MIARLARVLTTLAPTLSLALAAANRLTHEILEGLSANDLRAASTNVIIAHPVGIIQGVDQLFTGKVERVGGVKWVIKDGIIYDARKLLDDVAKMVEKQKKERGIQKLPVPVISDLR